MLVPLNHTAEGSNTPVSKAVIVRLEPSKEQTPDGSAAVASGAARDALGHRSPAHTPRDMPSLGPGQRT